MAGISSVSSLAGGGINLNSYRKLLFYNTCDMCALSIVLCISGLEFLSAGGGGCNGLALTASETHMASEFQEVNLRYNLKRKI